MADGFAVVGFQIKYKNGIEIMTMEVAGDLFSFLSCH